MVEGVTQKLKPCNYKIHHYNILIQLLCISHTEVLVAQSCSTLCDPRGCIHPGSSVHGILQESILEWADILSPKVKVRVAQSCPNLCNPTDYTVQGILQARILEWVAFPFSRGCSQPSDQTQVSRIAGKLFNN